MLPGNMKKKSSLNLSFHSRAFSWAGEVFGNSTRLSASYCNIFQAFLLKQVLFLSSKEYLTETMLTPV